MPDIAKCANLKCTKKHECYRFMCEASKVMQTYGVFEQKEDGSCDVYWPYECPECHSTGYHKMSCPYMKSIVHLL